MTDQRYSPLQATEFCGEMQGKFNTDRQVVTMVIGLSLNC